MATIFGIGEILWDIFQDHRQLGGASLNFAYHAHALGGDGAIISSVGEDALGQAIREQLGQNGSGTDYLYTDREHPTGTVQVTTDAHGKPTYEICTDVAWDFIPIPPDLLAAAATARAVCFGTLAQRSPFSRQSIRKFVSATPPDCLRVFDINLRQDFYTREVIAESLALANVLKLNDEEMPIVCDLLEIPGSEEAVLAALAERYQLRLIALTRGGSGSTLYTPEQTATHPGFTTTVVDTVGAGDSFTAAVTVGLLRSDALDTINVAANRLAAYVCSQAGAIPEYGNGLISD